VLSACLGLAENAEHHSLATRAPTVAGDLLFELIQHRGRLVNQVEQFEGEIVVQPAGRQAVEAQRPPRSFSKNGRVPRAAGPPGLFLTGGQATRGTHRGVFETAVACSAQPRSGGSRSARQPTTRYTSRQSHPIISCAARRPV
jgi:hypothetical protein